MNSLRRDLTRRVLWLTLLLVLGGLLALWFGARHAATEQFDDALRAKALAISTSARSTVEGPRFEFTDRFFQGFEDTGSHDYFAVADASGRILAHSESLTAPGWARFRPGTPEHPALWDLRLPNGARGRAASFNFRPKAVRPLGREAGPILQLVVASERSALDRHLGQLLGFALVWSALLAALTAWLVPRLLRHAFAPLQRMGEQAAAIDAASLGSRFPVGSLPLELQPIATRLNELLERLETSFARERRFSADLAHELRTPLAELKTGLEAAIKWPESRDPDTDREALAVVRDLEQLVTHLLALTRGEADHAAVASEAVDLDVLAERVWRRFAGLAAERRLAIHWQAEPCPARGDTGLLASLLGNLFENAAEYAPAGSAIRVLIARNAQGRPTLEIANLAPDLAGEDVPHLFDRFWRKEAARSGGGRHVGLGLSLARAFAGAMGWTLEARLVAGEGRLALALAGPPPDPKGSRLDN